LSSGRRSGGKTKISQRGNLYSPHNCQRCSSIPFFVPSPQFSTFLCPRYRLALPSLFLRLVSLCRSNSPSSASYACSLVSFSALPVSIRCCYLSYLFISLPAQVCLCFFCPLTLGVHHLPLAAVLCFISVSSRVYVHSPSVYSLPLSEAHFIRLRYRVHFFSLLLPTRFG